MKDLKGKTAFITGGASGLGLAMARSFAREGMKAMIADIDGAGAAKAAAELSDAGAHVESTECDVSDRASFAAAAERAAAAFGKIHILCNNAGIAVVGEVGKIAAKDWDWILDVNLKSVIIGMDVFLPLLESHGEGGHIVNTASMSALVVRPGREPYCATKYAILALSEGWQAQLAPRGIGVSVLCPGYVASRIGESWRARQDRYGGPAAPIGGVGAPPPTAFAAYPAETVGDRVVEAVKANELYIITHPEMRDVVAARFERILRAFDRAAQSPAIMKLPAREMPQSDRELAAGFRRD